MPYTLLLGRIYLPTLQGEYGLTAGDGLEAIGSLVIGGEARPRDLKVTIPIHGEYEDGDVRPVGDRLRRQLEALLENEAARLPSIFMRWLPFPDRDAWLAIGGGDFTDTEGGPAFGDYKLELDVKRAGTSASSRQARRLRTIDRRLATTPRDLLGRLFSSDFSSLSSLPLHFLPTGATDVLGAGGVPLLPGSRKALGGSVPVLANRTNDEVMTFERASIAIAAGAGDVVITDRRGRPDWTPRQAGPRNPSFDGSSGEGSVARWTATGSTTAGVTTELRASDAWTARPESRFSAYFKMSRADAVTILVQAESGAAAVPVTPGGKASLRMTYFGLQVPPNTVRARVDWYKADGSASATGSTQQTNADLGLPNLGRVDFGALVDVPADAAFGRPSLACVSSPGAFWEGYLDDVMLEDVTGLGLTAPRAYGDGESSNRVWLGDAGDSHHSLERQAAGHEEVYGPTQLLKLPIADVPVIENGLSRLRYIASPAGSVTFALDSWDPVGLKWLERGRMMPWMGWPATTRLPLVLQRASVVEWTPERAVLRVICTRAGEGRVELYVTLQRGWAGPRVELYTSKRYDGNLPGAHLSFAPPAANQAMVARDANIYSPPDNFGGTSVPGSSGSPNYVVFQPKDAGPAVALSFVQSSLLVNLQNDSNTYGDGRNGVSISSNGASYLSVRFGLVPSLAAEAETIIASATASSVADAAAIDGNATEETQVAGTNNTASAVVPAGKYAVWVRARVVAAGATGSFQPRGAAAGGTVTTTSTTYVWLSLGELDVTGTLAVRAWRSAGTGNVRVDRVLYLPVERRDPTDPAYDGARDHGQAELADARQEHALVSR